MFTVYCLLYFHLNDMLYPSVSELWAIFLLYQNCFGQLNMALFLSFTWQHQARSETLVLGLVVWFYWMFIPKQPLIWSSLIWSHPRCSLMGILLGIRAGCASVSHLSTEIKKPLQIFLDAIHFCFHLPKHVIAAQHALPTQPVEVRPLFGC